MGGDSTGQPHSHSRDLVAFACLQVAAAQRSGLRGRCFVVFVVFVVCVVFVVFVLCLEGGVDWVFGGGGGERKRWVGWVFGERGRGLVGCLGREGVESS